MSTCISIVFRRDRRKYWHLSSTQGKSAASISFISIHEEFGAQYKIELRVRNHNTLTRMSIIEEIAKCMPRNYVVDLDNPDVFVLVEVFKVCRTIIL